MWSTSIKKHEEAALVERDLGKAAKAVRQAGLTSAVFQNA